MLWHFKDFLLPPGSAGKVTKSVCQFTNMIGQLKGMSSVLEGLFITSSLCWQGNKVSLSVCLCMQSTFSILQYWNEDLGQISDQNYPGFFCWNCIWPCFTFLLISSLIMVRFSKFNFLLQEENDAVLLIMMRLL